MMNSRKWIILIDSQSQFKFEKREKLYHKYIHVPFICIFLFYAFTITFDSIACQTTNTLKQIFITTMTFILLLDK